MSRTRLYIEEALRAGSELGLTGNRARYIGRVLRLRTNDELTLFDGRGGEYRASVRSLSKNDAILSVAEHVDLDVESPLHIHLLQALSRGERMDFVVQKSTELGVRRITPVNSEYSVVRLDEKRTEKRVHHWRGIAASACEQCGRNTLPDIDSPVSLRNWLGDHRDDDGTRLILRPASGTSLKSVDVSGNRLTVLVGPEGGFSDAEYDLAAATGFESAGLGPRVLRTETAALAVLAALQSMFGDLA